MTSVAASFFASIAMPAPATVAGALMTDAAGFGLALQQTMPAIPAAMPSLTSAFGIPLVAPTPGPAATPVAIPVAMPLTTMPGALLAAIDAAPPVAADAAPPAPAAAMPAAPFEPAATIEPVGVAAAEAAPMVLPNVEPLAPEDVSSPTVTENPAPREPDTVAEPELPTEAKLPRPAVPIATPETVEPTPKSAETPAPAQPVIPAAASTEMPVEAKVATRPARPAAQPLDAKRAARLPLPDDEADADAKPAEVVATPAAAVPIAQPMPVAERKTDQSAQAETPSAASAPAASDAGTAQEIAPHPDRDTPHQQHDGHAAHRAPAEGASATVTQASEPSNAFALPSAQVAVGQVAVAAPTHAAASPAPAAPIVTAEHGRIGQEMGVAIARHVAADTGEDLITVRLDPKEFGRIEVKLSFEDDGTLRVVVAADNPAALDMLRRDSADLGRALNDAGVRSDAQTLRFDSGTAGEGGNRANEGWQQRQQQAARARGDADEIPGDARIAAAYQPLRTRGRVDLMA